MADLVIENALLFDGWSAELVPGALTVIDGAVAPPDAAAPDGARVIDARGRVVTPGLLDAHFHAYAVSLNIFDIEPRPLSYIALKAHTRLAATLRRGFTTVRDPAGGDAGIDRAIAEGLIEAPHYLFTGAALSQTGGHGDWRRADDSDGCRGHGHTVEVVDGVDALLVAVRERFRQGAHAIKIMTSGGVISFTDPIRIPQYSAEEIRAVAGEASRRGSYVAAHAYSPEAIRHSVENGVRSIEHGNLLDEDAARAMKDAGAYLVPTLAAYDAIDRRGAALGLTPISAAKNKEVLDSGKHAIELARDAGIPIGWGSDLMGPLADDQLIGLRLQAEVLGPLATLRAAIRTNAELFQSATAGRLSAGVPADLVIWDGDPLEDIAVITEESRPRTVVLGGRVVHDGPVG